MVGVVSVGAAGGVCAAGGVAEGVCAGAGVGDGVVVGSAAVCARAALATQQAIASAELLKSIQRLLRIDITIPQNSPDGMAHPLPGPHGPFAAVRKTRIAARRGRSRTVTR
jgi:hypothetical protein